MPEFKTIRQTAAAKVISESYLRKLVAQGRQERTRFKFFVEAAGDKAFSAYRS